MLALVCGFAACGIRHPAAGPGDADGAVAVQGSTGTAASGTEAAPTFLVVYSPGPAWVVGSPVSEQPMPEHLTFVRQLHDAGVLVSAGPFLDDTGGALVLRARSLAAAEAAVASDPAVRDGVMTATVKPWRMVDWARDATRRNTTQGGCSGSALDPSLD
jgi:uncharacterized protein